MMFLAGLIMSSGVFAQDNVEEIRKPLLEAISEFRKCYQIETPTNPNQQAKLVLKFSVGEKGEVTKSDVTSADISDRIRDCIKSDLQKLKFPLPKDGKSYDVNQPLNFNPKK